MRSVSVLGLLGLACTASGFTPLAAPPVVRRHQVPPLWMSSTEEDTGTEVPIIITGNNIELTPALTEYVNKKIGTPLKKLTSNGAIRECDVQMFVNKNPKVKDAHRVEVTTILKGTTIHAKTDSPDMYSSIDAVSHALNRKLRRYKERRIQGYHGGEKMGDNISKVLEEMEASWEAEMEEEEEEYEDPEAPTITKIKSFDLNKPTSVEEAVFALDYTDHDFYVFRNKDTNDINVVYKRNAGGVGHVEP